MTRSCAQCGAPLPATMRAEARYCGDRCRFAAGRARRKAAGITTRTLYPCACTVCETTFDATIPSARYCGTVCEGKAKSERWRTRPRNLCACGAEVIAPSTECRRCRRRIRVAALARGTVVPSRRGAFVAGPCSQCGTPFVGTQEITRVCSDLCRRRASRRARRSKYGRETPRKRTRLTGARYEPVDRGVVFERDGWLCQLCGDPVDRDAPPSTPLAPTIDHTVPLARGGDHTYENTTCAHFECNWRKGDALPAELELATA